MIDDKNCPHCGASLVARWHPMNKCLVEALVKTYAAISSRGENHVAKQDLDLNHSEYGNYQKLRFHALIAKYNEDGQWIKGHWLITKRGADFLKGKIEIPWRVKTFRNQVVDHDETKMISVKDVIGRFPYVDTEFRGEVVSLEQEIAFNKEGQGLLI